MSTNKEHEGLTALRNILKRMRRDAQDGYDSVGADGKFRGFISSGLPQATPKEIDALFALVGLVPDPIVPLGSCKDCRHATPDGRERGYSMPCVQCLRPRYSEFGTMRKGTVRSPARGNCTCRVCQRKNC